MDGVTVVDHVLLRRLLSILRDKNTPHRVFRETMTDAALILGYEAMRALRGADVVGRDAAGETPTACGSPTRSSSSRSCAPASGLVDGFLRLVPEARVGHLGMYRDEEALRPVGYYENIPSGVEDAEVFVVDPMLATGGSGVQAIARLKRAGARRLHFVCLVAAPEGVRALREAHPDVTITTADDRPRARRERLHPPRPGRRGRPHLRHRPLDRPGRSSAGHRRRDGRDHRASTRWERSVPPSIDRFPARPRGGARRMFGWTELSSFTPARPAGPVGDRPLLYRAASSRRHRGLSRVACLRRLHARPLLQQRSQSRRRLPWAAAMRRYLLALPLLLAVLAFAACGDDSSDRERSPGSDRRGHRGPDGGADRSADGGPDRGLRRRAAPAATASRSRASWARSRRSRPRAATRRPSS